MPPQTSGIIDFRDYTAWISADKCGGALHGLPQYKAYPPLYKTYPYRYGFCNMTASYTPPHYSPFSFPFCVSCFAEHLNNAFNNNNKMGVHDSKMGMSLK